MTGLAGLVQEGAATPVPLAASLDPRGARGLGPEAAARLTRLVGRGPLAETARPRATAHGARPRPPAPVPGAPHSWGRWGWDQAPSPEEGSGQPALRAPQWGLRGPAAKVLPPGLGAPRVKFWAAGGTAGPTLHPRPGRDGHQVESHLSRPRPQLRQTPFPEREVRGERCRASWGAQPARPGHVRSLPVSFCTLTRGVTLHPPTPRQAGTDHPVPPASISPGHPGS